MRILDLDLDFFLNANAYLSRHDSGRLGKEYKPWSAPKVRRFLEDRCGLSPGAPVQGRTVEKHDGVLDFWRTLIKSGSLSTPFDLVHIDAHPDIWVGSTLHLAAGRLYVEPLKGPAILKKKDIHAGNYLTFAIAYGWVASLVWIPLLKRMKDKPVWDGDARSALKKRTEGNDGITVARESGVPFEILPWRKFRAAEKFDYIALSRSPDFTPPESDRLIKVVEDYIKQI